MDNKRYRKSNRNMIVIILVYSIIAILASMLVFAIPDSLTLQGKLTDLAGSAQQGTFNFSFKIYDSFTEGNVLWRDDDRNVTTDANGIYDVILHNLSALNFSAQYYLGITVRTDNESTPRINLTSSPYSFRANISEDLNKENAYTVAVFNITGNLTVGESFADVLTVVTGRLNISDGSITAAGNLTLAEKITFSLGSIIDNIVNGFLRISSRLNVTGNVSIAQDTLFVDNTSSRVGIGTTTPNDALEVIGNVRISGSLNASLINATILRINNTLFVNGSRVGIGTSSPSDELTFGAEATISTISGDLTIDPDSGNTNVTHSSGDGVTLNVDAGTSGGAVIKIDAAFEQNAFLDFLEAGSSVWTFVHDGQADPDVFRFQSGGSDVFTSEEGTLDVAFQGGISTDGLSAPTRGIVTAGNVGINTSNPSETLTVNGTMNIQPLGTSALFVDKSGNVGIGTTSPYNTLTVIGSVGISGSLNASSINTTGSAYFATSSGSVGIGTISPSQKLEISGNVLVNNTASAFVNLSGPIIKKSGSDIVISD